MSSNCSSLQKTRSNATTLERKPTNSPRAPNQKPDRVKKVSKTQMSPEQLKAQLEQKILEDHKQNLKAKNDRPLKTEVETQKTENKYQKFGVKVLPMEQQKSPKSTEQNENNINIERFSDEPKSIVIGIDEVDVRDKKPEDISDRHFARQSSLTGSGIKRDANGIPQEIPNHMLNAAVAARKNRKGSADKSMEKDDGDGWKNTPKKQKGKAPAPPEEKSKGASLEKLQQHYDDIETVTESATVLNKSDDSLGKENAVDESKEKVPKEEIKDYNSDSDVETDNQSSVNTIELNSSDITIHQAEEAEEIQNRKTASTGDLTKINRKKSGTGTLERAQSLDITDTGIPAITKKRKAGEDVNSDDDLYCSALIDKEPRLSLILDGLNTFQRNRLKKSTEWGNLEDAILKLENESVSSSEKFSLDTPDGSMDRSFDFGAKSPEFDALVNKINEIKQETPEKDVDAKEINEQVTRVVGNIEKAEDAKIKQIKNQIWPTTNDSTPVVVNSNGILNNDSKTLLESSPKKPDVPKKKPSVNLFHKKQDESEFNKNEAVLDAAKLKDAVVSPLIKDAASTKKENIDLFALSKDFLFAERLASNNDVHKIVPISGDTNVSDDMKVSRHSLGSLERAKTDRLPPDSATNNVSSITINDKKVDPGAKNVSSFEISFNKDPKNETNASTTSELYTTAFDDTIILNNNQSEVPERVTVRTPDFSSNINEVTIEGPTSLTLEIPGEITETQYSCTSSFSEDVVPRSISVINKESGENEQCICPGKSPAEEGRNSSTLTFITEIQVTPNSTSSNVSEIEIVPNVNSSQNLDNKFENYVKNFEANVKAIESNYPVAAIKKELKTPPPVEKIDAEKELHKIQEIVEEQLKKLPEMRFTTSSYESGSRIPEKRQSQVELLKSNFEKSPPKLAKSDSTVSKSRIPIATSTKTPPMSPERRDSRSLEFEPDKDILAIMSQSIHSTPAPGGLKYQSKSPSKNVTVTSIRSNSKIPSGLPSLNSGRPPVPPRRAESIEDSVNGSAESSFKQWVFNPSSSSINVVVTDNKDQK